MSHVFRVTISGATSFAPGTVLWSAPPAPGYTPQGLFQAVPTDTGPSLYSVQAATGAIQTLVQAFTSDGQQLWQTALNSSYAGLSVPDGFGGVLATWTVSNINPPAASQPYQAAYVSGGAVVAAYAMPNAPASLTLGPDNLPINPTLVLGENGTAFASYGSNITSFQLPSGSPNWNYQAPTQTTVSIVGSAAGNSLTAKTTAQGTDTVLRIDPGGAATSDSWSASSVQFFLGDIWLSAGGADGMFSTIFANSFDWAFAVWPTGASSATNRAKEKIKVQVYTVAGAGVSQQYISDKVSHGIATWQTKAGILFDWDGQTQPTLPGCDPASPPPGNTCLPGGAFDITNATLLSQVNEIMRRLGPPPAAGVKLIFVNQLGPDNETDGYTPPEFRNASGIKNLCILKNNSGVLVLVAHELGHVLGLSHVNNPINLMCGNTGDPWLDNLPCWSTITRLLSDTQIDAARKTAAHLVAP